MKLYEINEALAKLLEGAVNEETGEVFVDMDAVQALAIERQEKLEGVVCWIKELLADAAALKTEEAALAARRKAKENRAAGLKSWLMNVLGDEVLETPRAYAKVRAGVQKANVDVIEFVPWAMEHRPDLLRFPEPEPQKKDILALLKKDELLPGCEIVREPTLALK